jgi:hypothetical protein
MESFLTVHQKIYKSTHTKNMSPLKKVTPKITIITPTINNLQRNTFPQKTSLQLNNINFYNNTESPEKIRVKASPNM